MPTVAVKADELFQKLGKVYTEKEFDDLCFQFGIELDEVTSAAEIVRREQGEAAAAGLDTDVLYKIDVPANRYDLLSLEGIARALRVFNEKQTCPTYTLAPESDEFTITVKAQTSVRPFVVGAVLRNVTFDESRYNSFIDLQDKLHQNICRRRVLASIGTHDLDTLKGPFTYEALPPKDISFIPLNQTEKMDGNRLMEFYSSHKQLKAYLPIIRDSPLYPVIYDSNRVVCSLPPIINGDHSKISKDTKNVFIEITSLDRTKSEIVLNTLVALFSEYCSKPFEIQPVKIEYELGHCECPGVKLMYPIIDSFEMKTTMEYINRAVGVELDGPKICQLLGRMSIFSDFNEKKKEIVAHIPITRSDILHPCDLAEDVAVAYGFNNLPSVVPEVPTWPAEQSINHLTDLIRTEIALAGFCECLTWGLCSHNENFEWMGRKESATPCANPMEYVSSARGATLSNPKTKEFEVVRTSLLPMLLKTFASNKGHPLPIKLFEVSDVVLRDDTSDTGARNVRRVAAVYGGVNSSGFEVIHGLVDAVMNNLYSRAVYQQEADKKHSNLYDLVPSDEATFFPSRQAYIRMNGVIIGIFGIVHPDVTKHFDIRGFARPPKLSMMELNLEPFLEFLHKS